MASIHRFEDIEAWQEARKATKAIYGVTREGRFAKDWGLANQVQRASVSAMTNIVEGFDSGSGQEFARFLGYSRRSASEVQSILYVALDQAYITEEQFTSLYEQAEKVRRLVTAFSRYLRTRQRANAPTRQRANSHAPS
jgi:four helix bundle protein